MINIESKTDRGGFVDWPVVDDGRAVQACRTPSGDYRYQHRECRYCGAAPDKIAAFCLDGEPGPESLWRRWIDKALTG